MGLPVVDHIEEEREERERINDKDGSFCHEIIMHQSTCAYRTDLQGMGFRRPEPQESKSLFCMSTGQSNQLQVQGKVSIFPSEKEGQMTSNGNVNLNPLSTTSSVIPTSNQQPINELLELLALYDGGLHQNKTTTLGNLKMMNSHNQLEVNMHPASQNFQNYT